MGPRSYWWKWNPPNLSGSPEGEEYCFLTTSAAGREGKQRKEIHPFFNLSLPAVPLAEMFMTVLLSSCDSCGTVKQLFLVKHQNGLEKLMVFNGKKLHLAISIRSFLNSSTKQEARASHFDKNIIYTFLKKISVLLTYRMCDVLLFKNWRRCHSSFEIRLRILGIMKWAVQEKSIYIIGNPVG